MTGIERAAIRDARVDFEDAGLSTDQWRERIDAIRRGDLVSPSTDLIGEVGIDVIRNSWGISEAEWAKASGGLCRRYDRTWCAAIGVLVDRAQESGR